MKTLYISALVAGLSIPAVALAGTQPAANQSQPTSSTVTPSSAASAALSAVIPRPEGRPSVSVSDANVVTFDFGTSPLTSTPTAGVATISPNGMVTITYPDGSTTTYSIDDL